MPRHGKPIYEVKAKGRTRWVVRASIRRGGRRKQLVKTFDAYEDAEKFYAKIQLGDAVPRSRDTFEAWTTIWLQRKRDEGCRENTVYGYEIDLIRPLESFGRARVQEITSEMIQDLVREMRDDGLARRTSAKLLTTVRSVFDLALRKGVVQFNPALEVAPMGRPPKERDALTAAELQRLRETITGDPWEACWMLTLAGLRRSELLGLRWSDFNLTSGELTINKGRVPRGGVGRTKTARGNRVLPLDQERVDLLLTLKSWQGEAYGKDQVVDGFIVINEFGRPMRPEEWTARWRVLCKQTEGVRDDHTLHAARHSTVTFMRNAGVPDHIVAAWHGHDEVIMRRTYSHVHSQEMRSAGSALSFAAAPPAASPAPARRQRRPKS